MASGSVIKPVDRERISSLLKTVTYEYAYSLNAGTSLGITANNFGITTPSGYTPVGIANFYSGATACSVIRVRPTVTGTGQVMAIRNNAASSTATGTAEITILYARTDYIAPAT